MKTISLVILLILSFCEICSAQSNNEISVIQKHYESFQYSLVISKSNQLLQERSGLDDVSLINIFTLKAASHFAIGDQVNSRKTFIELLKVNEGYKLNHVTFSPKLLKHFNEVKKEFLDILSLNNDENKNLGEINPSEERDESNWNSSNIKSAVAKSILLPGLGHLELNRTTKGWFLTAGSSVTLASLIYFIFDANSKEKNYLQETNPRFIHSKYDEYNKSYKIRNTLITTYAVLWLYSQMDLLFFSGNLGSNYILTKGFANFYNSNSQHIHISVLVPF